MISRRASGGADRALHERDPSGDEQDPSPHEDESSLHEGERRPHGSESIWVFGYGSLLYRPGFPYARREVAIIEGYERRFFQGSTDHRGTPDYPGRVVTLVASVAGRCHGLVFEVPQKARDAVLRMLDHREKGGYHRVRVTAQLARARRSSQTRVVQAVTYVAPEGNPNYLGPAPLDEMADRIRRARGPSGKNIDYLYALAAALQEERIEDPHVTELETHVRALSL